MSAGRGDKGSSDVPVDMFAQPVPEHAYDAVACDGLHYILGQIERAPGYTINIGQITFAVQALRYAMRRLSPTEPNEITKVSP